MALGRTGLAVALRCCRVLTHGPLRLERGIGHVLGQRPVQPGTLKRLVVVQTVDAASPVRRAISRVGTQSQLRPYHFAHSAHGRSLCWRPVPPSESRRSGRKSFTSPASDSRGSPRKPGPNLLSEESSPSNPGPKAVKRRPASAAYHLVSIRRT